MGGPGCGSGCDAGEGSGRSERLVGLSQTGEKEVGFSLFLLLVHACLLTASGRTSCRGAGRMEMGRDRCIKTDTTGSDKQSCASGDLESGALLWSGELSRIFGRSRLDRQKGPFVSSSLFLVVLGFHVAKEEFSSRLCRGASLVLSPTAGRPPMRIPTAPPSSHYGFRRPLPVGTSWSEPLCRPLLPPGSPACLRRAAADSLPPPSPLLLPCPLFLSPPPIMGLSSRRGL
jgi:hypothetical protein